MLTMAVDDRLSATQRAIMVVRFNDYNGGNDATILTDQPTNANDR